MPLPSPTSPPWATTSTSGTSGILPDLVAERKGSFRESRIDLILVVHLAVRVSAARSFGFDLPGISNHILLPGFPRDFYVFGTRIGNGVRRQVLSGHICASRLVSRRAFYGADLELFCLYLLVPLRKHTSGSSRQEWVPSPVLTTSTLRITEETTRTLRLSPAC